MHSDDLTPDYQLEDQEATTTTDTPEIQGNVQVEGQEVKKSRKPRKEIDRDVVIKLARLHCSQQDIARWFDVDKNTIAKRFGEDIELAKCETRAKLRRKMLEEAMNGNTTMLIWLSKNMLGFSDNGPIDSDDKRPLPWKDD
jgi:hypothetical protein